MNICVFLSATNLDERYARPVRDFGTLLAEYGHTLVWGGSNVGLMKVIADSVAEAGGSMIGVSVEFLSHIVRPGVDEMIVTADLAERKELLREKADVVVVAPGGMGTLDETTDILELKNHYKTGVPVIMLNTEGFYNGLREQFQRMEQDGFLPIPLAELVHFADTEQDVFAYLDSRAEAAAAA
ncbi:lysine decarboxylase [Kitasatospora sp. MMS16-BH015]|uniref:LOG family protein n=1 Tax=Kitasatospora sp. MMS16-BH015 TaxID=2018025 RepID=UPI000CA36E89|nr:TIGR00730 family Rossman fold protein [Kitasatospora sp. MMS16-BH015]AUG78794.1 lysine decarboxylase [Kitasatospora sp. MMS16-BH015]